MNLTINKEKFRQVQAGITSRGEKKYTLLLVDDEPANIESLIMLLEDEYTIRTASNGREALALIQKGPNPEQIHLIISDQRMPEMTGVDFFQRTLAIIPKTIRILLTAYTDVPDIIEAINQGQIYKYLTKPIEPNDLVITVKRALEAYELEEQRDSLIEQLQQINKNLEKTVQERTEEIQNQVLLLNQEIEVRKEVELELKETYQIFHMFTDNSPDVLYITDLTAHQLLFVSPSIERVSGFTVEEAMNHRLDQVMTPASYAYLSPKLTERARLFLEGIGEKHEYVDELEHYHKDGSIYISEVSTQYQRNKQGDFIMVGVLRDITNRKMMETALQESEKQFRNIFENAPVGIFHSDWAGHLLTVNPALVKMLGYLSPEDLVKNTTDMTTQIYAFPTDRQKIMEAIRDTDGWVHYDEVIWRRKDGKSISVDMTGRKVLNPSGETAYLEGFIEDITERKQAERALLESESFNRGLVENLPDYIIVYGYDRNILYVNPAITQALGYLFEEMVSMPLISFYGEESRKKVADISSSRIHGVDLPVYEVDLLGQDQRRRSVIVKGTRIQYKGDEAILLLLIDITQRKQMEQALKENEEKFISIFEETPDPILILNSAYQMLEVNRGFEEIFEYAGHDIIGKSLSDLPINLNQQTILRILEETAMGDYIPHKEMNLMKRTGGLFTADVSISRIIIHSEPCLLIQIHDIDEIRRAHDAVAQVNHKLKILSSVTRHDILNRIMVTSAYSEMIKEAVSDPATIKRLDAIQQSSEEIQTLIEFTGQYQDLGATAPDWQEIEVILKTRSIQGLLKGVTLLSTIRGLEIYADMMLEKVIYNLVENSVRHGQNLSSIQVTSQEKAGNMLVWYEDDGGGIADTEKDKAFEKGFGKNTGLGLFLIREILSITGITIVETGEFGKGVRFEIRVPNGGWRFIS